MTAYVVTLRFRYPAWDERDGIRFDVDATGKREAVKRARRLADDAGHLCAVPVTDYTFTAVPA